MKPLLPPGLVLGTSLFLALARTLPAQTASPSPSIAPVTFGPPTSSPAPSRAPEPVRTPPSWVLPPNPAPVIPPRPVAAPAPFLSGQPDFARFERARPQVEVWRANSVTPQRPGREGAGRYRVWTVGTDPVTIVLKFHPLLAGRTLRLLNGVDVRLSDQAPVIGSTGEVTVSVQLEANRQVGEIVFNLDSIKTVLRLQRAPREAVTRIENQGPGGTP